jgi:hypothetical protein
MFGTSPVARLVFRLQVVDVIIPAGRTVNPKLHSGGNDKTGGAMVGHYQVCRRRGSRRSGFECCRIHSPAGGRHAKISSAPGAAISNFVMPFWNEGELFR